MAQLSVLSTEVTVCGLRDVCPLLEGVPLTPAAPSCQPASLEHVLPSLTPAQDGGMDFSSAIVTPKLPMFFPWKYIFAINILY